MKDFKIIIKKNNKNLGIFKIYNINSGYGVIIGNSLRRVLLSSIYGYAINYFKIKGIKHELSYIKGFIEDVPEIILNLKKIRFKLKNSKKKIKTEKINIKINNKKNKIYAGEIEKYSKYFKIINKKLIICNKDEKAKFNIKIIVKKGKGYIESENKPRYKDYIAIDSIYTPILNVKYFIKQIDNYNENIEKIDILRIEILTDSSIKPLKALIKASKILIKNFNNLINKKQYFKIRETYKK
ncbi:DNA-directed RNA polymerase subunit alpha [Candidatus Shikimatogenerans bostrichidophilus]|uniref:DNA-directed RNA polymerase subunit alpha n=1 Tax=Candidatus Shikimatogenerans bostrichidophilus TaxID=2943807 RepID=UPI002966FA55